MAREERRRERTDSRILEHVLATNETPTVVKHDTAGEDVQVGVFRRVYYNGINVRRRSFDASAQAARELVLESATTQTTKRGTPSNVPE